MAITLHGTRASNTDVLTPDFSGAIIQVVNTQSVSDRTTTSTSYASMTDAVTITPSSSSNKILIMFQGCIEVSNGGRVRFSFKRGSTDITPSSTTGFAREQDTSNINLMIGAHFLDSPSTTSSTTYTLQALVESGNQLTLIGQATPTIITAMEVVA